MVGAADVVPLYIYIILRQTAPTISSHDPPHPNPQDLHLRLVRSERVGPKVHNAPCSIWDDTSRSDKRLAVLCRRIDEVLTGQLQLDPDCPPELERTPSASPPNSSPASAPAPPRRPTNTISNASIDSLNSCARALRASHVGDGSARAAPCSKLDRRVAARSGHDCRAHSGLRARHPALARAAELLEVDFPWGRCSSIAPPMR